MTVISCHHLRGGQCKAWTVGPAEEFLAAVIQWDETPLEPEAYGRRPCGRSSGTCRVGIAWTSPLRRPSRWRRSSPRTPAGRASSTATCSTSCAGLRRPSPATTFAYSGRGTSNSSTAPCRRNWASR
jgi:hypothetical protein